jgi:hypothetical protein
MRNKTSFPEGWQDGSIIMIEYADPQRKATTPQNNLLYFSFLRPFEGSVWWLILATVIASGLVFYLLEKMNMASDERMLGDAPATAVFYAALTFTGHLEFQPQTHAARLLTFSLGFSALIVGAAYTANLASFLVDRRKPVSTFLSIQDAVAQRVPICLQDGVAVDDYMKEKYNTASLVRKGSEAEVFQALVKGDECVAAVVAKYSYETYLQNSDINSDCGLTWDGRVEKFVPSGLATRVDTGDLCTSLVGHVVDLHMLEMDQFLDKVWEEHVGNQNCMVKSSGEMNEDDTFSLSIREMSGIFIVHAVLTSIAVLLATFQFFKKKRPAVFVEPEEAPQINGSRRDITNRQPPAYREESSNSRISRVMAAKRSSTVNHLPVVMRDSRFSRVSTSPSNSRVARVMAAKRSTRTVNQMNVVMRDSRNYSRGSRVSSLVGSVTRDAFHHTAEDETSVDEESEAV